MKVKVTDEGKLNALRKCWVDLQELMRSETVALLMLRLAWRVSRP